MGKNILIRAPKVPFNFHVKSGMENDIFLYFNFDSKLKIEKFLSFFNFQFWIEIEIHKNVVFQIEWHCTD